MKKNEDIYTWDKDKIESYPTISLSKILIGCSRFIVFLPVTIFFVLIFLIFKFFLKPLKLYSPIFFVRKVWSFLILRLFGLDYGKKLESAGFKVTEDNFIDNLDPKLVKRYALPEGEIIYFCEKK